MIAAAVTAVIAYFLGAIPFGFMVGRLKGVDIRRHGSGNIGATNTFRILGPAAALIVVTFDVGKGVGGVLLGRMIGGGDPWIEVLGGLAAIVGHNWTVFLRFRGGKGMATTSGAFLALMPWTMLQAGVLFGLGLVFTRFVSLGSLLAALALAVLVVVHGAPLPYRLAAWCATALIVYGHRENIGRLWTGTEHRFGERASG